MPTLQYSDSPNVDTAFVVDGDKKHRAVLTAPQDTSTLELPDNPNSTKGYVTVDGKKHKVILTANIAGGGGGGGDVSSVNGKTGAVVLDAEDVGAVPQYETLPTPSADNLGEIAQYSGETNGGTGTATISQTVGSGMTNLAVNTQTFIEEEQPTESGNFNFVCTPSVTLGAKEGDFTAEITDVDAFFAELQKHIGGYSLDYVVKNLVVDVWSTGIYYFDSWNVVISFGDAQAVFPATVENGITITGNPQSNNYQQIDSLGWFKKGDDYVNLDDYGITYGTEQTVIIAEQSENVSISSLNQPKFLAKYNSIQHSDNPFVEFAYTADGWYFSEQEGVYYTTAEVESEWGVVITGTPVADTDWVDLTLGNVADCETGDTLTVNLTFTAGATNGYFYKSSAKYSDPTATISQTTGSGLTDLAVDVDTFVAEEQPTQSENVAFVADVTTDSMVFTTEVGNTTFSIADPTTFKDAVIAWAGQFLPEYHTGNFIYASSTDIWYWWDADMTGTFNEYNTATLEAMGIVITGTPQDNDRISFVYTDGSTSWTKGGETVDLADYGITYTGTPVDNDTLTVVYTAPAITGYAWNQINVQPQPEIPEPVDIKWATSVDLPESYGYPWDCYPIYTIAGGLPDGTYDFYWQIKVNASNDYATGLVTYHGRIKINNVNSSFYGEFSPVINDGWLPNSSDYVPRDSSFNQFLWDNGEGTDLMIFANSIEWKSTYPRYVSGALPECFKISVIKNVDTGVEYTPTGALWEGNYPQYSRTWSGTLQAQPLAPTPYIPVYHTIQSFAYTSSNRYMFIGDRVAGVKQPVCSEFDFSASTSNGKYHIIIENLADGYVARVIEASGDLATAQVGLVNSDLYFDFNSAGNSGNLKVSIGTKGSSQAPNCYFNEVSAMTPLEIANVGETVGINNIGLIEQYKGATDANYTNGYFYKSEGTIVVTPKSMVASDYQISGTPVNDITITIDTNSLISALLAVTGWGKEYLENMLISQPNWNVSYDFDNSTVAYVTWTYWGSIYDQGVLNCFTVSTTGSYSGQQEVFFTGTYTPETKSVTGGTWTRVDVQPLDLTGVTGYDATKTQVLKNVQGTLTWVDE